MPISSSALCLSCGKEKNTVIQINLQPLLGYFEDAKEAMRVFESLKISELMADGKIIHWTMYMYMYTVKYTVVQLL